MMQSTGRMAAALILGGLTLAKPVCATERKEEAPRLLLGFERDEFVKIIKDSQSDKKSAEEKAAYVQKKVRDDGPDRTTITFNRLGYPFHLTLEKGDVTQGEWAFVYGTGKKARRNTHVPGSYQRLFNFRGKSTRDAWDVFNTCGVNGATLLPRLPGGRDWTGFHKLWLDVRCDADATVRLGIEDEDVMPFVARRFRIPAGEWVTVEIDLEKAKEVRDLDISKMMNLYVFVEEIATRAPVRIDNLRLATRDAVSSHPVVVDEGSYEIERRAYAVMPFTPANGTSKVSHAIDGGRTGPAMRGRWKTLPFPEDAPPPEKAPGGDTPGGPWQVDMIRYEGGLKKPPPALKFIRHGILEPVAYDATHIAVPVVMGWAVGVVATTDGGATWGPVSAPSPDWPVDAAAPSSTLVTFRQDGCGGGAGTTGDETYLLSNIGCCSWDWHSDRLMFSRIELTESGWRVTPAAPVDIDMRHCSVAPAVVRLPSGRMWAIYDHLGRFRRGGIAAMYSDDAGATWHSWRPGKTALLPGSLAAATKYGYGGDRIPIVPYGDKVACFVSGKSDTYMWTCEGTTWSDAAKVAVPPKSTVWTAVSPGGASILVNSIGSGAGVYRIEGTGCAPEQVKGYAEAGFGYLSLCGDTAMLLGAAEVTGRERGRYKIPRHRKILRWTRGTDGAWSDPVELVHEDEPIGSFSCTRFAPDTGAVLAWTCEGSNWIKVMIVRPQ